MWENLNQVLMKYAGNYDVSNPKSHSLHTYKFI